MNYNIKSASHDQWIEHQFPTAPLTVASAVACTVTPISVNVEATVAVVPCDKGVVPVCLNINAPVVVGV